MRAFALISMVMSAFGCGDNHSDATDATDATLGWSAAPPVLGGGVQEIAVVAQAGKVYVVGGFDASIEVVDKVRVFDTATSAWSDGPDLPRPLHHANAAVVGETIYVLGAMVDASFTAIGDVFAWNPNTDASWTVKTSMPVGSERGSAVVGVIGDRIFVAGGARIGITVATLSSYSTTDDTWDTTLPPLPQPIEHGCGGVIGGKLYALGGRYQGNSPLVFEYTPGGTWVQKTSMPTARSGIACGTFHDQIIVAGGELNPESAASVFANVEAYAVSTDTWTTLPSLPTPRHGMGAAVVDGVLHVPGGATKTGFEAVDTHEVLRL